MSGEPVFEIIEGLAPPELHADACRVCAGKGWYFGHSSLGDDFGRFWKMDLEKNPTFDTIWEQTRERCEALASAPLRVIRQYANGHTYGLGGQPHLDDTKPGCFTLLYYAMPEWKDNWEGETVFYGENGEIAECVAPRPNRAVFFDSRIPHAGRAPGRMCPSLRITVAYKLEVAAGPDVAASSPSKTVSGPFQIEEIERDGPQRAYRVRIPAALVTERISAQLAQLSQSVRLPGFRPGKIPAPVMEQRYGAKVRTEVVNRFAAEAADWLLPQGGLPLTVEVSAATSSGDLDFRLTATHLPDLPPPDCSQWTIERLRAGEVELMEAGVPAEAVAELLSDHLRQQVLDYLDAAYSFPLAPVLVDRELATIWPAAEAELNASGVDATSKRAAADELRLIAERRVRLGAVIAELARRFQIRPVEDEVKQARLSGETAAQAASRLVESKVLGFLVEQARVSERLITADELRDLRDNS